MSQDLRPDRRHLDRYDRYDRDDDHPDRDTDRHNGAAEAALVLGLASILLSVLTGVPAILAGLLGLARARSRGRGTVPSVVGLVLGAGSVLVLAAAVVYLQPAWGAVQQVRSYQEQGLPAADSPQVQQGMAAAHEVLEQVGVDSSSLDCDTPDLSGTDLQVRCAGLTGTGDAAAVAGTCPAPALLGGGATCEVTVNGEPTAVRVTLVDGVPHAELLR